MLKSCSCGENMKLGLRTVVFAKKVNIMNVPVYNCSICGRNDVFHAVKDDVGRLIGRLGSRPAPVDIPFDQINELAGVLSRAYTDSKSLQASDIAKAAEERTNQLLDMWLLAASVGDDSWQKELENRLAQLNAQYIP